MLASGALQYFEKQGLPKLTLVSRDGQATFSLEGSATVRPWFHFPWSACNGATEWQIHLNPTVSSDITAHTDGGNVDVVLPECAANLSVAARTGAGNITVEIGSGTTGSNIVNAKSGAGNVEVYIPSRVAARIHATTGLGKVMMDPQFSKIGDNTYQSSDFNDAANKVELIASSGAGNVIADTR